MSAPSFALQKTPHRAPKALRLAQRSWALALFLLLFCSASLKAQVGIGILTPDPTAILHLEATDRGFLGPRMTLAQRNAIATPATGLVVYNTTDSLYEFYNGVCWLPFYLRSCGDCDFNAALSALAGTIDRALTDSVDVNIDITQLFGTTQNIAGSVVTQLPNGVTATIGNNPTLGSGTMRVVFRATPFAPAGTYPVVLQVVCGSKVQNLIYSLTLTPCYVVDLFNNANNYNLATALYAQYPTAPTNVPLCIVSNIGQGVTVTSPAAGNPAYTEGNVPAGSRIAIVNNGIIFGKGGNGGIANDPTANPPLTGEGENGGDAIILTTGTTTILNNGYIFVGGGGGPAMAFRVGINIPAPVNSFFGFLIGAGGGGGAGGGLGGNTASIIGLSFYSPGQDGTSGVFGVPGNGGILNFPINLTFGPASITINPNVRGGNGGVYGAPGTTGVFQVTINVSAVINIPFIGPVTIPLITNLNLPIPVPVPPAGQGGFAVRRNGNTLQNLPDNTYNTAFIKGRVGN